MILNIHSDALYLSEREANSRTGGLFYMGINKDSTTRLTNGAILIISTIIKDVILSAAEEEDMGSVFLNAKEATFIHTTLEEMGQTQTPTPLQTDNTPSAGYINNTITQKTNKGNGY
jgi:hypothetical protein